MNKFLAVAALIALSFSAAAHDLDNDAVKASTSTAVAEIESIAGEGKTAFVLRVSEVAREYTARTGHETCGYIAYGGASAFSIKLTTLASQVACAPSKADVVAGYSAGNETLHSHPEGRNLRLTRLDRELRGKTLVGASRTERVDNCRFSTTDYSVPGYLVACGKVLHQKGRGTETEVNAVLIAQQ